MKSIENNIYPLTLDNLRALLEFYFPKYYTGNVSQLLRNLRDVGISLRELEFVAESVQQFVPFIEDRLGFPPSQVNLLMYGLEAFVDEYWDYTNTSIERSNLIYQIRKKAGIPTIDMYAQMKLVFEQELIPA